MEARMLDTLTDVATASSVSRRGVCDLIRIGALVSVRIGASRRVHGEDLASSVDSLQQVSAPARVGGW